MGKHFLKSGLLVLGLAALTACGTGGGSEGGSCPALTGSPWTPAIAGASSTNHDAGARLLESDLTAQGPLLGLEQPAPVSMEIPVDIDMTQDLGAGGSLTLVAQAASLSPGVQGGVFPLLVSLHDGANELVNLTRSGAPGDCVSAGYFKCTHGQCDENPGCRILYPSAYTGRTDWGQHQTPNETAVNSPSVNVFPTCGFDGGDAGSLINPTCEFNSRFFPAQPTPRRLRFGGTYSARYLLLSTSYPTLVAARASLRVKVIRKLRASAAPAVTSGGAVDLNVFLVGNRNVQASRSPTGQAALDFLISTVGRSFGQEGASIRLGAVRAVEWNCDAGGDAYSRLDVHDTGALFSSSGGLPALSGGENGSLNLFLVSTIEDASGGNPNLTVLGIDGAIGGPPIPGTPTSGFVVSTFNQLDQPGGVSAEFRDLSQTIVHEMGHFLGLNHLSESDGLHHDRLHDTPVCTESEYLSGYRFITQRACQARDLHVYPPTGRTCHEACPNYQPASGHHCPEALECPFNHIMWWTSRPAGDGSWFTPESGIQMRYHPLVR